MQGPLVELEHFRELLKYMRTWPASSSVLNRGIRAAQVLRQGFSVRFSDSFQFFCSRQAHSFLHLALGRDAASFACSFLYFLERSESWTESAAPLNPFIGAENRII